MLDVDAVVFDNVTIPDALIVVTPDNAPDIVNEDPELIAPPIPTPPVTTKAPVDVLDDTVLLENVITPDAVNATIPETPLELFKTKSK